ADNTIPDEVPNLNRIAVAGGTQSAIIVSVSDPAATKTAFQQALEKIRGASLTCVAPLPLPPAGQTLDVTAVNVVLKVGGGQHPPKYSSHLLCCPHPWPRSRGERGGRRRAPPLPSGEGAGG